MLLTNVTLLYFQTSSNINVSAVVATAANPFSILRILLRWDALVATAVSITDNEVLLVIELIIKRLTNSSTPK